MNMTHDAEAVPTLQQFLRTISMATPQQVVVTAAEAADHIDAQDAKIKALVKALEVFAKHADKRKRKSIEGSVCFSQPLLIAAREALAAAKEPT